MAERQLPKLNVAGSIPVSRSKNSTTGTHLFRLCSTKLESVCSLISTLLRSVPDTQYFDCLVRSQSIHNDVSRKFRNDELPCAVFQAEFPGFGKAAELLRGVIDGTADPVGGRRAALTFNVSGDGLQIFEGERSPANAVQRHSWLFSHPSTWSSSRSSP